MGNVSKRLQVLGDVCACVALAACSVVGFLVFVRYLVQIEGWLTAMLLR